MAANGKHAHWLLEKHPFHYGYGPGSPLEKLYQNEGKILLLGSDLDQITILHYAEHMAPLKEKRIVRFQVPLLQNNQRVWLNIEEFDTSIGIRQWPDRFFETIVKRYIQEYKISSAQIGNAHSILLDVKSLVDFAIPIFVESAAKYSC
jgi:aminoglycoside 3-N-acetyltransferase